MMTAPTAIAPHLFPAPTSVVATPESEIQPLQQWSFFPPEGSEEALASHRTIGYKLQQGLKRLMDLTLTILGLIMISPILIVLGAMVKVTSPGPIFYKSLRIGKGYKPFYMLKFRTMRTDADALREQLRQEAGLEGNLFKIENDPRVTKFGAFLRAFSLDELPQLLNVLRGEMSLVGPRPLPPDESALFDAPYTLRFNATPGITGLWQVSGRSNLNFKQLCELEFSYVTDWRFFTDIAILFKTIPAVLASKGAY
jgi:lipopolysaccharide/colanic/teichoic acid biosynthesis glycosyltransferase